MAKAKAVAAEKNGKNSELEGFNERATADMAAGWWKPSAGAQIIGKLLGGYDMPDSFNKGARREYIQLKVLAPCDITLQGEDAEAERGDVVSVGITYNLMPILDKFVPMVEAGGDVHLKISTETAKVKTKSGNSVWPFKFGEKIVASPTRPVVPRVKAVAVPAAPAPARTEETDVPF